MRSPLITLTTDFGHKDPYVGVMKGVVLSICPEARLVDLTHEIPPQGVSEAAFVLAQSFAYFPSGTIHVAVVDPGVGTSRTPIIARTDRHFFVGPDNGVFGWVERSAPFVEVVAVQNPEVMLPSVSNTFHGRDVFAPAAAHLACGRELSAFGPRLSRWAVLDHPEPEIQEAAIVGQVLWVDRFGNLITNIARTHLEGWARGGPFAIGIGPTAVDGVSTSYAGVEPGQALAIFGSSGFLELAVNRGSAARAFSAKRGDRVRVVRKTG